MRLTIDQEEAARNSRLTGIHLSLLTLRWMEYWKRNVADYDSALIAVAVVAITAERWTRADLGPDLRDLASPLPATELNPCNVTSLAAATGLNRETTRRKVKALIDEGILTRDQSGAVSFAPGHLQNPRIIELVRRQLESFARTADELFRIGVLKVSA